MSDIRADARRRQRPRRGDLARPRVRPLRAPTSRCGASSPTRTRHDGSGRSSRSAPAPAAWRWTLARHGHRVTALERDRALLARARAARPAASVDVVGADARAFELAARATSPCAWCRCRRCSCSGGPRGAAGVPARAPAPTCAPAGCSRARSSTEIEPFDCAARRHGPRAGARPHRRAPLQSAARRGCAVASARIRDRARAQRRTRRRTSAELVRVRARRDRARPLERRAAAARGRRRPGFDARGAPLVADDRRAHGSVVVMLGV